MTIFKSKIGLALIIPVIILLGLVFYFSIINHDWEGTIITSLISSFFIHLYLNTNYTILDRILIVKASFIIKQITPINEIKCISRTNNPLSAPALLFDKIEILYSKMRRVIISPKDRSSFINQLPVINPNIKYIRKN